MATTTYTIFANDTQVGTKSKKSTAVDFALATRNEQKVATRVETQNGTVVAEFAAPKKINMSAPYTRVVAVAPEVGDLIKGKRVAYFRKRVGFALLDAGRGDYSIYDVKRGETVGDLEVGTTREAGRWFADEAPALRALLDAQA